MFSQIEDSVERGTAGMGIGLTLVRTLVELHGGTVSAHSDGVDQGSEFSIKIPIAESEETQQSVATNHPSLKPIRPLRVLVVDDMRALCSEGFCQCLTNPGGCSGDPDYFTVKCHKSISCSEALDFFQPT